MYRGHLISGTVGGGAPILLSSPAIPPATLSASFFCPACTHDAGASQADRPSIHAAAGNVVHWLAEHGGTESVGVPVSLYQCEWVCMHQYE